MVSSLFSDFLKGNLESNFFYVITIRIFTSLISKRRWERRGVRRKGIGSKL